MKLNLSKYTKCHVDIADIRYICDSDISVSIHGGARLTHRSFQLSVKPEFMGQR